MSSGSGWSKGISKHSRPCQMSDVYVLSAVSCHQKLQAIKVTCTVYVGNLAFFTREDPLFSSLRCAARLVAVDAETLGLQHVR